MEKYKQYDFKTDYKELSTQYAFETKKLTVNKDKINFVVTHGNCSDGFMSATIVQRWLIDNKINLDDVKFVNVVYGADHSKLPEMMKNKYVLICDYSFKKELFDRMIEASLGNILILDDHKTALNDLKDVPSDYLVFDMKHSGAFLTWTYMYGFSNIPKAVLYVEDNDIWNKELPLTREFHIIYVFQRIYFR